jgi:Mg/Co/Ni transporter MgtE
MDDLFRGLASLATAFAAAGIAGIASEIAESALTAALAIAAAIAALSLAGEKLGGAADAFGVRPLRLRGGKTVEWSKIGAGVGAILGLVLGLTVVVISGLGI